MCRLLFRALIALSLPAIAGSQQVTGVVRDSSSRAPIAGAVVSVMDASGVTLRRAITDASGRWSLAAVDRPARIHVIKIGFRPADVAVPGEGASFDVAMVRLPAVLEAMRISGREICPGSSDRGAAFQLWEQARAGLLAAVVARELKPAAATMVTYERAPPANHNENRTDDASVSIECAAGDLRAARLHDRRLDRPFVQRARCRRAAR
jgi:hypothetical protein